jgi:hypothetical protein
MALPASGEISINDINVEFGRSGTTANSSLEDLSDGTVATINTVNASGDRPDGSAPHSMSEFYSYDHDAAAANASFGTWSDTTIRFVGLNPGGNIANHAATTNALTDASGAMSVTDSVTSGVAKGSPRVALGTSDPGTNSSNTVFDSKMKTLNGNQHGSITFSGSVTCHARFCFAPHSDVTESVMRDITFTNNNTSNTTMTLQTSVTNFGGFCVHEAVPVNCKDYYKHISELEIGDMVMSYNFETDSIEEVEILKIEKPNHSDLVVYYFEDMEDITYAHGNTSTLNRGLSITKDHPIYKSDGTMVCLDPAKAKELYGLDAQEIKKGDEIRFMDKIRKVEKYLLSPDETETYTILTKNNNFYAGGVLVHSEIGG